MASKKSKAKKATKKAKGKPGKAKPKKKKTAKKVKKRMTMKLAMSVATSTKKSVKDRVAAMAEVPMAVCEEDDHLQALLTVLRDEEEPLEVRFAALQTMQAASFSTITFESCRSDYIATLRKVAKDPDPELRQRVLGILAREKDGFAQKKLMEGLEDADKALVSPEKALQLLSYDVHADAYQLARKIVSKPPNVTAKREALRLLAADASASKIFQKILGDKKESVEIRQICAAALHSIDPKKLYSQAKKMLHDLSEDDEIQATCLTALTQFADSSVAKDKTLVKRVQNLKANASSMVKKSARQFLDKYDT